MCRRMIFLLCGCSAALGLMGSGCGDDEVGGRADAEGDVGEDAADVTDAPGDTGVELPTTAPTSIALVVSSGFTAPGDGVASPDGSTFYFTAFTADGSRQPGIFSVPASGGAVEPRFAGDPLEYPTGLVMACDGETLFVADMSLGDSLDPAASEIGSLYALALESGELVALEADGIAVPSGLAMGQSCDTLYVTGYSDTGEPALFTVSTEGGTAAVVHSGAPLVSPTGVHVDVDDVAWVMDHLAIGEDGPGALFSITSGGDVEVVVSGLRMGAPGGVSLAAGGVTAVIPEVDAQGNAHLVTVDTASGERSELAADSMVDPAGIRTARQAGVFIVVDSEGGAIFRAQ